MQTIFKILICAVGVLINSVAAKATPVLTKIWSQQTADVSQTADALLCGRYLQVKSYASGVLYETFFRDLSGSSFVKVSPPSHVTHCAESAPRIVSSLENAKVTTYTVWHFAKGAQSSSKIVLPSPREDAQSLTASGDYLIHGNALIALGQPSSPYRKDKTAWFLSTGVPWLSVSTKEGDNYFVYLEFQKPAKFQLVALNESLQEAYRLRFTERDLKGCTPVWLGRHGLGSAEIFCKGKNNAQRLFFHVSKSGISLTPIVTEGPKNAVCAAFGSRMTVSNGFRVSVDGKPSFKVPVAPTSKLIPLCLGTHKFLAEYSVEDSLLNVFELKNSTE